MKTEKNILIAFLLNLAFSVFELVGGFFTGSVAIISDAVHDAGDAASIGISYFLERRSKKQPDESHTYGYARYSVIGSVITTLILLLGSMAIIYNAILRILYPAPIHYDGMILFAIVSAFLLIYLLFTLAAAVIAATSVSYNLVVIAAVGIRNNIRRNRAISSKSSDQSRLRSVNSCADKCVLFAL